MDKAIMKRLFSAAGLPVAPYLAVTRAEWAAGADDLRRRVEAELGWPVFVKPARLGSSVGISKVNAAAALDAALGLAFDYDYKVLVERGIPAREIECSVMGNLALRASVPGEIIPCNEFYDYDAKYVDDRSELLLPAPLEPAVAERVRGLAVRALEAIGGEGYGRVDFLLDRHTGELWLNEINTIPGFTEISMFPKLWGLSGFPLPALLDELVRLALERHAWKAALRTTYEAAP
jgi:D-alanine-D-alanine ligase